MPFASSEYDGDRIKAFPKHALSATVTENAQLQYGITGSGTVAASFTIVSPDATVTGTKSFSGTQRDGFFFCGIAPVTPEYGAATGSLRRVTTSYNAVIYPTGGIPYRDEGTSTVFFVLHLDKFGQYYQLIHAEYYTSRLTETVPVGPTNKEQCKDNGWQAFGPLFKNQGECVAYHERHQ